MEETTPTTTLRTASPIRATGNGMEKLSPDGLSSPALRRLGQAPTLREEGGEALALAGIAHDARNLVTALGLCAEMISAPGVLAPKHGHFGAEIRSIAESSAQLVWRLTDMTQRAAQTRSTTAGEAAVTDLSESVQKIRSLLSAIAGPVAEVEFACLPCPGRLRLSEESLSRILVNLVRNAADAMPTGGRVRITTQRGNGASFLWTVSGAGDTEHLRDDLPHGAKDATVVLTVEDDGPGIPTEFLERVFETGFTTRQGGRSWPEAQHRGLGLSIVRELVEAAGGAVRASRAPRQGTRIEIELPLTNVTGTLPSECLQNSRSDAQ